MPPLIPPLKIILALLLPLPALVYLFKTISPLNYPLNLYRLIFPLKLISLYLFP